MERILVAIDGQNFNRQSVDFACYLAELTHSKITAVFLEDLIVDARYVLEETQGEIYMNRVMDRDSEEYVKKMERIEKHISLFRDACERKSLPYSICKSEGDPVADIVGESRYADMLILDAETSFSGKLEGIPTKFVKEVLKQSECPVFIAPGTFMEIDQIILTYNGSRSSMFAIRQFSYLFPEFGGTKVIVLEVDDKSLVSEIERAKFKEWMGEHYAVIEYKTVPGNAETELFTYLLSKKDAIIVMGAYGRPALSRFFKKSHADLLLKVITQGFFISHY